MYFKLKKMYICSHKLNITLSEKQGVEPLSSLILSNIRKLTDIESISASVSELFEPYCIIVALNVEENIIIECYFDKFIDISIFPFEVVF